MRRNSRGSVWNRSNTYGNEKSVTGSIAKVGLGVREVRCDSFGGGEGGGGGRRELIALAEVVTSSV